MERIDMHDNDLRKRAQPEDLELLERRTRGATALRLLLARVFGRDGMATARQWSVVVMLTDTGTVGLLDIAAGAAWDTLVPADEDILALGVSDSPTPEVNHPSLTVPVYADGVMLQTARGQTPGAPITAPPGWQRIDLPPWRGYDGDGYARVPEALFTPEHWVQPKLKAVGLVTCYGDVGGPVDHLAYAHGHERDPDSGETLYPHGLPEWVAPGGRSYDYQPVLGRLPEQSLAASAAVAREILASYVQHLLRSREDVATQAADLARNDQCYRLFTFARDAAQTLRDATGRRGMPEQGVDGNPYTAVVDTMAGSGVREALALLDAISAHQHKEPMYGDTWREALAAVYALAVEERIGPHLLSTTQTMRALASALETNPQLGLNDLLWASCRHALTHLNARFDASPAPLWAAMFAQGPVSF